MCKNSVVTQKTQPLLPIGSNIPRHLQKHLKLSIIDYRLSIYDCLNGKAVIKNRKIRNDKTQTQPQNHHYASTTDESQENHMVKPPQHKENHKTHSQNWCTED